MLSVNNVSKSKPRPAVSRGAFMAVTVASALVVAGLGAYCVLLNAWLVDREAQVLELKTLVSSLDAQVSQLSYWLEANATELKSLRNRVRELETELEEKDLELTRLKGIVSVAYSEVLEHGKVVSIPANSYTCLNYTTPYAGYLLIQFSSTGDVYMEINIGYSLIADGVMEVLYMRYPEEGAASTGRLLVAVLPEGIQRTPIDICIYNPSALGVEVTIDITYWY